MHSGSLTQEVTIVRDDIEITIGEGGDMTEKDIETLRDVHAGRPWPLPIATVRALASVMRAFKGAKVVKRPHHPG